MEEVEFQEWLKSLEAVQYTYSVVYDPNTMQIIRVGPTHALEHEDNCVDIDSEIAERILSGEISIHSCYLDVINGEVAVTETKTLLSIDDILHRIPSKKWSKPERLDVYLELNTEKKQLSLELGSHWGGSYVNSCEESFNTRKIKWNGDTEMEFLVTDYNDPNIIYDFYKVSIEKLINSNIILNINIPDSNVSIYTRRIFKNYVVEYV